MKHLEKSYSTLYYAVQFPIFAPWSPHPPAFTCICGNAIHYACDWVCGSRKYCICNKGLNEAFGEKLFSFMLISFRYLVLSHPTPLRLHDFTAMHSIILAIGSVDQKKLAIAITVLIEATGGKLFNFILSVSDFQSFFTTPSCVYMHL